MSDIFNENIHNLADLCDLPRQSVCFQILILLNMFSLNMDTVKLNFVEEGSLVFFDSNDIRGYMANHKTTSNIHKGFTALLSSGFIERLVINQNGENVVSPNFKRNTVTIYYRMSDKAKALFS